jgi:peptide/nickel transport system permease protein
MNSPVLEVLIQRTPATAELLLLSFFLFVPAGLISGVVAGWRRGRTFDLGFRLAAFIATSIPTFILGLMLLAIFYIGLNWFPAGRISLQGGIVINDPSFKNYTHMLILDGLLNWRLDISVDALRHLFLPAFTLSLTYWATLGRITRATMIEELHEDYITTARGKGVQMRDVVWRHAFRNSTIPGLNSIALSAAMFLTNAIIIEIIFGYPGVSKPLSRAIANPLHIDVYMAMGFAIYSTMLVLPLMLILDILQAVYDPRIREGVK